MILDERLQELAGLYVLGALEGAELREFEDALRGQPELRQHVAGLQPVVEAIGGAIPLAQPPAALRARILAQIDSDSPKIMPRPERPFAAALWWWRAFATGLAVVCVVLLVSDRQLHQTITVQSRQLAVDDQGVVDPFQGHVQAAATIVDGIGDMSTFVETAHQITGRPGIILDNQNSHGRLRTDSAKLFFILTRPFR